MRQKIEQIKIAYLIDTISCDTSGTERQLLGIIERLNRKKFEPYLICLWQSEWMKGHELPCPCSVLGYRGFVKLNFADIISRLRKLILEKRFRIVQTYFEDSIFVAFLGGVLSRPSPILLSSRRDIGLGAGNQPWYHGLFRLLLPYVNKKFAGIVANGAEIGKYIAHHEKVSESKIRVIHNGISIPEKSQTIPDIFARYKADVWLGIVASLTPVKRHDVFLKGLASARKRLQNVAIRAVVLGKGPEKERLLNLAQALGVDDILHFEGAVADVPSYLYRLNIGVLCSDREGFSNAILEYMACGLPVVATSVGGNVELIDDENGFCVPPNDATALAKALTQLINSKELRIKKGANSLTKIKLNYSWHRAMAELEGYYLTLVENGI